MKAFCVALFLAAFIAYVNAQTCDCGKEGSAVNRIFSGSLVRAYKYPWLVHLRFTTPGSNSFMQCGGSIIDEKHILTAAHCLFDDNANIANPKNAEVYVGRDDKFQPNTKFTDLYKVSRFIHDPRYNSKNNSLSYDIAILELTTPITFNNQVAKACLPAQDTENFKKLTVAGWGSLDGEGTSTSKLWDVEVDYLDRPKCQKMSEELIIKQNGLDPNGRYRFPQVHENHLCAVNLVTKGDSCRGDSGGPITVKTSSGRHIVLGVVSGAWADCGAGAPGYYTSTKSYRDFIRKNAPNSCWVNF